MTKEKEIKKVKATKMDNILYIEESKRKFVPAYVYYILEYHKCNRVGFKNTSKLYHIEDLKGKDNWKDVE